MFNLNNYLHKVILSLVLLLSTAIVNGQEKFKSDTAHFQIEFPTNYDDKLDAEDDMTVVTATCTYKGMIIMLSAFIYKEKIPTDDYAMKIAEGIIVTADAFNSKFDPKKCIPWEIEGGYAGLQNPIKGKVKDGQGKKVKFFGNIYITIINGIEYRLSIFSGSKSSFDKEVERKYIQSFKVL
ncbi:hypothetical protein K6119_05505 [Paracrocinitomix mangrovi]|uniref:hypothetical protein n=1 Tax=Paracrocinitomix mangrovi TaxID=2862509 RepID=UPI001C8EC1B2|nr:hypothetical protein [Paracrocinitomix mangrovi]UKN02970.1 hypothetical protein K6119_05505 [Paracrocinitomix mangrovi]